jgi:DNA invertase Pin-like site-specific DNA recombinase
MKTIRAAIYARVSTEEQSYDMQLTELRDYARRMGWETVEYTEKESSVKKRPEFDRMFADAKLRKFDLVLVWKIDRFARSMKHFVDLVLDLKACGVGLLSVTQNIDSRDESPMGRFILHLFANLAELERGMILDRVNAGIREYKRATEAGRQKSKSGKNLPIGRPTRVFRRDEAVRLRAEGSSWRKIARELGVPVSTVVDACSSAPVCVS